MHNQKANKWIILIYVLFLVTLSIVFSTILLNNNAFLFNVSKYFDVDSMLYSNINKDWKILVDINRDLNLNWSWFIDNISCPELPWGVTMSWTFNSGSISTYLVNSWSIYCEWDYFWDSLKLYFNTWYTDIIEAEYSWSLVSFSWWIGVTPFWDLDNTLIDISFSNYLLGDNIDDNFNSDNYKVTSTWNTATGTYYSGIFQDDDVLWRKTLYWYAEIDNWFKKVFWNTFRILKIIDDNLNNNDDLNIKIWQVWSWVLYFDIDKPSKIKLVQFDEITYFETNELIALSTFIWDLPVWSWYLQNNAWILSLSETLTWNEFQFNFINNDYAIFLKNTWTWALLYKISWETTSWTGIYITPIDDSDDNIVRYIWNEILIDEKWRYISKETELIYEK